MDAPLSAGRGKTEASERKPRGGGGRLGRGGRPQVCYNCGQEGHISAECPNPKVEGGVKKCYNCGELGHISADCPQPKKEREPRARKGGKGTKRGRGGPRSASDLAREMDMYHGKPG